MSKIKLISKWLVLVSVIALAVWAKQSGFFEITLEAVRGLGFWSVPAFLAVYILSCLFFFPSLIMTLGAGMLFPIPLAVILCLIGNSAGSAAALLVGRYGLRDWVGKAAEKTPQFQKLDEAIRREGWKIAVLARLTPVFPFSVGNYLFGASSISAWSYALAAFIGTIPSASVYALAGHITGSFSDNNKTQTSMEWVLLLLGVVATILLSIYLTRFFRRILKMPQSAAKV